MTIVASPSSAAGRGRWLFAAPGIPATGHGPEPAFTSHDVLGLLNTGGRIANARMLVHYPRRAPVGPYRLTVAPRRLRRIRLNDLIFPEALRLEQPYGLVVESDEPLVAHLGGQHSLAAAAARTWTLAFAST